MIRLLNRNANNYFIYNDFTINYKIKYFTIIIGFIIFYYLIKFNYIDKNYND